MSIGFGTDDRENLMIVQSDNKNGLISTSGFVNRRSGVQSPHPAPRFPAYFRAFSRFCTIGNGGIGGTSQRFIPPQKPDQLFPACSRGRS